MSLRLTLALPFALAALTLACDDGATNDGAQTTAPTQATNTTESPDTTSSSETTASTGTNEPTVATEAPDTTDPSETADTVAFDYPEGPYSAEYLGTMADVSFYDPWLGVRVALHDYYKSEEKKVLVITSGAGWCTACQYEAWDLVDTYANYADDGLEVLYTIYEDQDGKKLWREGADAAEIDADFTFLNIWKVYLGNTIGLPRRTANYRVLVDDGFKLGAYYDKNATPMTLIVRTSDMKILYRQIGYSSGAIETIVKGVIF